MNHLSVLYSLLLWFIICGVLLFCFFLLVSRSILIVNVKKRRYRIVIRLCALFWLIMIIRIFFLDVCRISGSSMEPTLKEGDYVLVLKFAYGPRIRNIVHKESTRYDRLLSFRSVKREDLVVFNLPIYQDRYVVKRVIGLPGEYIDFFSGEKLPIEEKQYAIPFRSLYIRSSPIDSLGIFERRAINYYHADSIKNKRVSNFTFNHSYYYVLGDNRENSEDSRRFGAIQDDHIIGQVILVIFSKDKETGTLRDNRALKRVPRI